MKVGFPGQRKRTRRRIDCFYLHKYHDGESKNGAYMMNGKIAVRHAAAASYETETFYAAITDISDSSITVQGMEINDINFRGRFTFPVMEETSYLWRGRGSAPKTWKRVIIFRLPLRDWYRKHLPPGSRKS